MKKLSRKQREYLKRITGYRLSFLKKQNKNAKTANEAIKALQESGKMTEISMEWFGQDMTKDIDTELIVIE